jgi:phasin family protein
MTENVQSYIDMLRNFAGGLGLPKLDVDKLVETHRKNIDALGRSVETAAAGAQAVAKRQRETLEASLREASTLAREFRPLGDAKENLARQTEFARKVFDITLQGARESAQAAKQSTGDSVKIVSERLKETFEEVRDVADRAGSETGKK